MREEGPGSRGLLTLRSLTLRWSRSPVTRSRPYLHPQYYHRRQRARWPEVLSSSHRRQGPKLRRDLLITLGINARIASCWGDLYVRDHDTILTARRICRQRCSSGCICPRRSPPRLARCSPLLVAPCPLAQSARRPQSSLRRERCVSASYSPVYLVCRLNALAVSAVAVLLRQRHAPVSSPTAWLLS